MLPVTVPTIYKTSKDIMFKYATKDHRYIYLLPIQLSGLQNYFNAWINSNIWIAVEPVDMHIDIGGLSLIVRMYRSKLIRN